MTTRTREKTLLGSSWCFTWRRRATPWRFRCSEPELAQHRPDPIDRGLGRPHPVVDDVPLVGLREHVDLVDLADRAARVVRYDELDVDHVRLEGADDRLPHPPDVRRVLARAEQGGGGRVPPR